MPAQVAVWAAVSVSLVNRSWPFGVGLARRALAASGAFGAIIWIGLAFFPPDWGQPGTAEYETYQTWNRLWAPALLLMALGFAAPARLERESRSTRGWLIGLFVALLVMAAANVAEFWFFTDIPYRPESGPSARDLAWITFLLGFLGALVAGTGAGLAMLHARQRPAWVSLPLALVLVLTIAVGAAVDMGWIGVPLGVVALVVGAYGLGHEDSDPCRGRGVAPPSRVPGRR